jgi:hypothetical protein
MTIAHVGTLGNSTSAVNSSTMTLTTTTDALGIGDFATAVVSIGNLSAVDGDNNEHVSITGGNGTWTKLGEYCNSNGAAGAGVTVSAWYFEPSGTNAIGTTFTLTLSGARVDKIVAMRKFTKGAGLLIHKDASPATNPLTAQVDAANDFGSMAFSGLSSKPRLWLSGNGKKANTATAATPSSGFTLIGSGESRVNAAATYVAVEMKISTSTGETSAPTLAVSGVSASVFFALEEYDPAAAITPGTPIMGVWPMPVIAGAWPQPSIAGQWPQQNITGDWAA